MSNQQPIILDQSDLERYEKQLGLENSKFVKEMAINVEKRFIQKLLQTEDVEEPKFLFPEKLTVCFDKTKAGVHYNNNLGRIEWPAVYICRCGIEYRSIKPEGPCSPNVSKAHSTEIYRIIFYTSRREDHTSPFWK